MRPELTFALLFVVSHHGEPAGSASAVRGAVGSVHRAVRIIVPRSGSRLGAGLGRALLCDDAEPCDSSRARITLEIEFSARLRREGWPLVRLCARIEQACGVHAAYHRGEVELSDGEREAFLRGCMLQACSSADAVVVQGLGAHFAWNETRSVGLVPTSANSFCISQFHLTSRFVITGGDRATDLGQRRLEHSRGHL